MMIAGPIDPPWLQTLLALMGARGIPSWAELARRARIQPAYCRMIGAGMIPGPDVRGKVAQALDVDQLSIWPTLEPGQRRPRHRRTRLRPGYDPR